MEGWQDGKEEGWKDGRVEEWMEGWKPADQSCILP